MGAEVEGVPVAALERHAKLTELVEEADWRYYVLDAPTVSDAQFDTWMRELRGAGGGASRACSTPDSPTQKVGAPISSEFTHGRAPAADGEPGQRLRRRRPRPPGRRGPSGWPSATPRPTCAS